MGFLHRSFNYSIYTCLNKEGNVAKSSNRGCKNTLKEARESARKDIYSYLYNIETIVKIIKFLLCVYDIILFIDI